MAKVPRRTIFRPLALMMAMALAIGWTAWPALAQDSSESAEAATEGSKIALIMDASDSMSEEDVDGGTRLDAAKRASQQLVDSMPETAQLGMLAYGASESNAPDNRERGCQDIDVLAPVERINKEELNAEIDALKAQGYTPMGNALKAAADELGGAGERSIILVSDGIDTCAPPPVCEVAEELAGDGFDLAIHTVGFKADAAAQEELKCVSNVSGGTFVEADNAEELGNQLEFLAQRDAQGYQVEGTEFEYADTVEDAKWLDEGQYQTRVEVTETEDDVRYFRVAVPEGHHAHISVTGIPDRDASGQTSAGREGAVFVGVEGVSNHADGSDCRSEDLMTIRGGKIDLSNYAPTEPRVSTIEGDKPGNCDMNEWIVGHSFYGDGKRSLVGEEISVEVNVTYEEIPPENQVQLEGDIGSLAQEEPEVKFSDAQDIEAGTSFNNAVEVEPGTYANSIVAGEVQYYRVPVEWGQVPQVALRNRVNENIEHAWMTAQLLNPVRAVIADNNTTSSSSDKTNVTQVMADRPLRYNNRNANWGGHPQSMAGDYFIAVSMSVPRQEESLDRIEQDYELAVDVRGAVDEGSAWRPSFEPGPEPSDTPPTFDATSDEATETTTAAHADEDSDVANAAAEGNSESGFTGLIWGTVGVLILGLIAIIGVLVFKLRKKQ